MPVLDVSLDIVMPMAALGRMDKDFDINGELEQPVDGQHDLRDAAAGPRRQWLQTQLDGIYERHLSGASEGQRSRRSTRARCSMPTWASGIRSACPWSTSSACSASWYWSWPASTTRTWRRRRHWAAAARSGCARPWVRSAASCSPVPRRERRPCDDRHAGGGRDPRDHHPAVRQRVQQGHAARLPAARCPGSLRRRPWSGSAPAPIPPGSSPARRRSMPCGTRRARARRDRWCARS